MGDALQVLETPYFTLVQQVPHDVVLDYVLGQESGNGHHRYLLGVENAVLLGLYLALHQVAQLVGELANLLWQLVWIPFYHLYFLV